MNSCVYKFMYKFKYRDSELYMNSKVYEFICIDFEV